MPVLRRLRERACAHSPAQDAGVPQAAGHRYPHEDTDVPAGQAPGLHEAPDRRRQEERHTRSPAAPPSNPTAWQESTTTATACGPARNTRHPAATQQSPSSPDGTPLRVSDAGPGSTPDTATARIHALPALHKTAADSAPTPADTGRTSAGTSIHIPVRRPEDTSEQALHTNTRTNTRTANTLIKDLPALGEHTAAELRQRWHALKHIPPGPSRTGDTAPAAPDLNGTRNDHR